MGGEAGCILAGGEPDMVRGQLPGFDSFHEILHQELVRSAMTVLHPYEFRRQAFDFVHDRDALVASSEEGFQQLSEVFPCDSDAVEIEFEQLVEGADRLSDWLSVQDCARLRILLEKMRHRILPGIGNRNFLNPGMCQKQGNKALPESPESTDAELHLCEKPSFLQKEPVSFWKASFEGSWVESANNVRASGIAS